MPVAISSQSAPPSSFVLRRWSVATALFLVSAAGLAFEITLTRVFSFLFQYHFAFLAVSLAVLGLSLGAALGRFVASSDLGSEESSLLITLVALGLGFPLTAVVMAWLPSTGSILPHAALALVPFVLIGLFAALTFTRFAAHSGLLYGADLMGAAVGVALVLGLLSLWSAFSVVICLGAMAGLAGVLLTFYSSQLRADRRYPASALAALLLSGGLLAVNLVSGWIDLLPTRLANAPRDKTMIALLNDPTQFARVVHTTWNAFARVDVVETSDPETKYVFTDGGAGSFMLRFDGNLERVAYLKDSLEYIPLTLGPADRTLILGAGAGKDVVLALLGGAQQITAVEVNPAMTQVTREFADYNGDILDRPGVHLVVEDARTFVERTPDQYDLIYLNLVYTQASAPASQALVESYIFTRQAFRTYLQRLTPGGHLAIITHNALEGSRAALTGLQVLVEGGMSFRQASRHMALMMYPAEDPTQRTTVLVLGKNPLADEEIRGFAASISHLDLQPLFIPGGFELLFDPLLQSSDMQAFLAGDPTYDLSPTDDDRPFFFKLDPGLPSPVRQALTVTALLCAALLGLSLWPAGRASAQGYRREWVGMVVYAALVGTGFMLVEVSLIQRFQLLLGYPILTITAVLGALLLAAGLGSLLSQGWPQTSLLRRVIVATVWVGAMAIMYWLLLPHLVRHLLAASLAVRLLATVGLTTVLGIPMGVPFPSLLRLASKYRERVALLWATNGAFSVLGSTLAVLLYMSFGFTWAMMTGVALYVFLAGLAWVLDQAG